jgi:hypothetical protein
MDNIIIPLSRDCANADLRDFCIMTRFCSHIAFRSSGNVVVDSESKVARYTIFTIDRAQTEIEAARSTYLHYVLHSLPLALSSDNLDAFHRVRTVAAAATEFIGKMLTSDVAAIQRQCIEAHTSWILELLPYINQDKEIRFPMSRAQDIISLVSSGLSGVHHVRKACISDELLSGSVSAFCHAASNVPNLDDETKSRLLFSTWEVIVNSNPISSSFETFCTAADVWRESLVRAAADSSPVPHQAVAFERFVRFFFSQKLVDSEEPVQNSPYALAAKHMLDNSCHLFLSVSQHKALSTHVETLFRHVLSTLFKDASQSESAEAQKKYIEVIYALESSILGCIRTVVDWFQEQISSCNSCDLLNAAAFHSVIYFVKSAIAITKPTTASERASKSGTEPQFIQSVLNMSISQFAPKILESYISKYISNIADPHESFDLPGWFVPVETLSSVLETAVHSVQLPLFSKFSNFQMPTVRLDRNNMLVLFCLRIHLRLFSEDKLLSAPNFIIENIINLCSRSVVFEKENETSSVFVPDAYFDLAFNVISTAATKYCILSPKVLISIVQTTNDLRKEIIGNIAQNTFDTKAAAPVSRQKLALDLAVLQNSLNRSCRIIKVIFSTFIQSFTSESPKQLYREAMALHVRFLCEAATAVISSREPYSNSSQISLQHILTDLPYFMKQPSSTALRRIYDDIKQDQESYREFYKLLFSLIRFPDAKLYPFQESGLIAGFDLQDSLLDRVVLGDGLLIRLQRLEHIVRVSQTLVLSHFDGVDVLHEPKKLLGFMQAFPVILATQFQQLWCGVFTSYKAFILDKIATTKQNAPNVQAQQRSDWAEFFSMFQAGSVQGWFERVAHVSLPVPLLTLGDDARIRPFVISHFVDGLLMSAANSASDTNSIFGAFQPTELLALCAPTLAISPRQNVRSFVVSFIWQTLG